MHIEVDQSGKVEQLERDTIVAFSNKNQYSIKITKLIKRKIYMEYRNKIKDLTYRLFCIGVYYCIKDYIKDGKLIIVCCEYKGKENLIKSFLLDYLRKDCPDIDTKIIRFGIVSKCSNAHAIAIDVYRNNRRPNRILSKEEIIKFLRVMKK